MKHKYREMRRQAKRTLTGQKQYVLLQYATFLHTEAFPCQLCMAKGITTQGLWKQYVLGFGKSLQETHEMPPQAILDALYEAQTNGKYPVLYSYPICQQCLIDLLESYPDVQAQDIVVEALGQSIIVGQCYDDFTLRILISPQINVHRIVSELEGQQTMVQ